MQIKKNAINKTRVIHRQVEHKEQKQETRDATMSRGGITGDSADLNTQGVIN